ncbi:beta-carotene isomerase D27, chloroplastic isoform X2 [Juglans microcarpa x Juglans regia]|uniref:beta-carotene isomerase D27, chloroplastic isoform X2 n=1 Tax=Juglans microcarpa x Juglans regia TaxID=2249226 RepID=UPI001B7DEA9B|nr:beta-carotene isomerase D27, chloroplastic isoform X2 [Juglans microcarpa x Juglans regia]
MKPLALLRPLTISSAPSNPLFQPQSLPQKHAFRVLCSSFDSKPIQDGYTAAKPDNNKPGILDDLFLNLFRNKMVQEVGWDSEKPGYEGLIEVANRLMMRGRTNSDTKEAAVRILISLFPPFLLELYRILIAPIGGGKIAATMVFVERCKYLEESKCIGICINTCKLPTQAFFKDYMGVPLLMEPNFTDYSCQFRFGVLPPLPEDDISLKEPCLEICRNATRRRKVAGDMDVPHCPKA